jgi:hypothetical protein
MLSQAVHDGVQLGPEQVAGAVQGERRAGMARIRCTAFTLAQP